MGLPRRPFLSASQRRRRHTDRGSGAVLGLALLGLVAGVLAAVLVLAGALGVRQRTIAAADAAALAAADAASGAAPGDPCALARAVATADSAELVGCRVDGVVAEVTVTATALGVPLRASARAGPPLEPG